MSEEDWGDVREVASMVMTVPIYAGVARYGGVYEGGSWLAWRGFDRSPPGGAWGDDMACCDFFDGENDRLVGRGETPLAALADLRDRLEGE